MADSSRKPDARRTALVGLFGGVLAIPALALAASALFGSTDPEAVAADATSDAAEVAPADTPTTITATADDLRRACGRDGKALVEAEAARTISDVEQAALDALRPICQAEGMRLTEPPAPEPIVVTAAQQSDVTTVTFDDDDDFDDDSDDDNFDDDSDDDSGDDFDDDHSEDDRDRDDDESGDD